MNLCRCEKVAVECDTTFPIQLVNLKKSYDLMKVWCLSNIHTITHTLNCTVLFVPGFILLLCHAVSSLPTL